MAPKVAAAVAKKPKGPAKTPKSAKKGPAKTPKTAKPKAAKPKAHKPTRVKGMTRNKLVAGIELNSRSSAYHRAGRWAKLDAKGTKPTGGFKKVIAKKAPKKAAGTAKPTVYPAEDAIVKLARRHTPKTAQLRTSITPGTVLILLSGAHRGKRVVFLKQLASGLLLITGPFKLNGVPLRRVNQAYVIATSTKVALPKLDLGVFDNEKKFFTASKASFKQRGKFTGTAVAPASGISAERAGLQKRCVEARSFNCVRRASMFPHVLCVHKLIVSISVQCCARL
jgi:large subunit ribosomal protein L6e